MRKVLVTGGRTYSDRAKMFRILDLTWKEEPFILVHGAAVGADTLAAFWAQERGDVEVRAYPADWEHYRRAAGSIRNWDMLRQEKPDLVIAFPGGTGTNHMKTIAREAGVEVREIK